MINMNYAARILILSGAFVQACLIKKTNEYGSADIKQTIEQEYLTGEVLLDSGLMRIQAAFVEEDSVATVYMLNQLDLRPKIGYLMSENLRRHQILDEESYAFAKRTMENY